MASATIAAAEDTLGHLEGHAVVEVHGVVHRQGLFHRAGCVILEYSD